MLYDRERHAGLLCRRTEVCACSSVGVEVLWGRDGFGGHSDATVAAKQHGSNAHAPFKFLAAVEAWTSSAAASAGTVQEIGAQAGPRLRRLESLGQLGPDVQSAAKRRRSRRHQVLIMRGVRAGTGMPAPLQKPTRPVVHAGRRRRRPRRCRRWRSARSRRAPTRWRWPRPRPRAWTSARPRCCCATPTAAQVLRSASALSQHHSSPGFGVPSAAQGANGCATTTSTAAVLKLLGGLRVLSMLARCPCPCKSVPCLPSQGVQPRAVAPVRRRPCSSTRRRVVRCQATPGDTWGPALGWRSRLAAPHIPLAQRPAPQPPCCRRSGACSAAWHVIGFMIR